MKYVVGHKSPDTDTIVSAIAFSEYKKSKGEDIEPIRQGELNDETKFLLEKFGFEAPKLVTKAGEDKFVLVDHNSYKQSVDNLKEEQILAVFDHHRIKLNTVRPIYFHSEAIGSTASILTKMFFKEGFEISKNLAGILLGALLSDTVVFKSATTTEEDKKIAEKLAEIAEIKNIKEFGIELKKKNADVSKKTANEIVTGDFKLFEVKETKYGVGQVELVELEGIKNRKDEILQEMEKVLSEKGLEFLILAVTDIMKEGSDLWIVGKKEVPEKAFGKTEENAIWLEGVMSRKKQIIPPINENI